MNIARSLTADSSVIPQPPTMIYSIDLLESSPYTLLVSNGETILQKWRKKSNFETLGTYHHTEKVYYLRSKKKVSREKHDTSFSP